jgi:hypothetical protein
LPHHTSRNCIFHDGEDGLGMERTVPPSMISIWKPESAEGEAQGRPVGVAVV